VGLSCTNADQSRDRVAIGRDPTVTVEAYDWPHGSRMLAGRDFMTRQEVTVQIHAWLEEREIRGLRRAFRGRLSRPTRATVVGVGSLQELHRALDRMLRDAGLIDDEGED
jgi:hypothetical protein